MPHAKVEDVRAHADERFDATVERLKGYLRIPAISCDESHFEDVRALATQIVLDSFFYQMHTMRWRLYAGPR